ncbi:MAG: HAD-IA family hydrolase [Proteobacteria bacterium]|nr:HAD-IA family hydrolase [Pseudomonadota bacterium]
MSPRLCGVLFDAAGTLFELRESVGTTYARFAGEFGVALPAWRLDDAFARVLERAGPMHFPGAPPDEQRELERKWWWQRVRETFRATDQTVVFADFNALAGALFRHFGRGAAWQLRAGAVEGLAALRAEGLALGVVSNFDHRLPKVLEDLEIDRFFDALLRPDARRAPKPAPDLFAAGARALGQPPAACVYVGDDPETDLAAARRAGLSALDVGALPSLAALPRALATLSVDAEASHRGEARNE